MNVRDKVPPSWAAYRTEKERHLALKHMGATEAAAPNVSSVAIHLT